MVILVKRTGQLGNRLFLFAHFLANAAEYGYELANPSFGGYAPFFEATATGNFGGLPVRLHAFRSARLDRVLDLVQHPRAFGLLQRASRLLPRRPALLTDQPDQDYDLNQADYLTAARSGLVLAHGWQFRDKRNFARHGALLRRLFAPIETHRRAVAELLSGLREQADVVVGVHIRRGDYATYNNGAYFYDNATYARAMRQVQEQLPAGQRVLFLLCSNEALDFADFGGLHVQAATGHFVEDLYALAACDYVLGPPSSYSMWASFYGQVPLLHLEQAGQPVSLSAFQVFLDQ
ncbi:alpha-1,2-fucosyltransferase [Hymenobacter chitinivorans]|uniref:Glycosyl transferase family 11 n=1 Tax=Hymenobacter chitinivorans DSM 11115 TaxID=1121954 RepID=A0A2M9BP95_9BACT|nr:alpha-1,2-fucosyltransferase [Hymenobacter chitinivorans]PJJ59781.1 glycosyl transferase family 11 [Hymenobacter chitinivorans DSM 11115]